jgi:hypothetical protein
MDLGKPPVRVVGKKCNQPEQEIDGNVPNRKSFIVDIFFWDRLKM